MPDPDFATLVPSAQAGNRAAFEQLVGNTARIVYAQIVSTVRDRQKSEDLTQETFFAAWKSLHTVNDPNGFTTWLLTLARNVTLDHARFEHRQKRRDRSGPAVEGEAAAPDPPPPEELERTEARTRALQLLEDLPQDYRQPMMLRYLAGADYATIRKNLNLSDGALRGLLNRGMALLRERMSQAKERP